MLQIFLKLHYTKIQLTNKKQNELEGLERENNRPKENESKNLSNPENPDIDESRSLFEEAIQQFHTLQNNMIATLVKHVASEFKMKSDSYKRER